MSLRPHAEGAQLITEQATAEGRVLPSSVEMGPLIVLHWQAETTDNILYFALLRDAFARDKWRILKVWLRWSVLKQAR